MRSTVTGRRTLSTSTLTGDAVVDAEGEDLGQIEDFMIDLQNGRVDYTVLSFGGFLGMVGKLFAVPFELLDFDLENERVLLDVDRETIQGAPGFDETDWPDTTDEAWHTEIHDHWGSTRPV